MWFVAMVATVVIVAMPDGSITVRGGLGWVGLGWGGVGWGGVDT